MEEVVSKLDSQESLLGQGASGVQMGMTNVKRSDIEAGVGIQGYRTAVAPVLRSACNLHWPSLSFATLNGLL